MRRNVKPSHIDTLAPAGMGECQVVGKDRYQVVVEYAHIHMPRRCAVSAKHLVRIPDERVSA